MNITGDEQGNITMTPKTFKIMLRHVLKSYTLCSWIPKSNV